MKEEQTREMIEFLRANTDVFACEPADLTRINPAIAAHCLNIILEAKPVKQKRRHLGQVKDEIIEKEVRRLLEAGHIRQINFPVWLSNAVLVKNAENKWRMSVDFRDLNKVCPKDHYPLPRIDQFVGFMKGCEMLSMMDASLGYHQIALHEADKPKLIFFTSIGTYYYKVMPFGLKNTGATYQRLVDEMFKRQLGRNMEVYVDDMLVKIGRRLPTSMTFRKPLQQFDSMV